MTSVPPVVAAHIKLAVEGFELATDMSLGNDLTVLFGPSGSGKSLLLRTLAGLLTPTEGRIQLGDRVIFDSAEGINLSPQARNIGYMPQQYALFPHLSVEENISYGLFDWPKDEKRARVQELIKTMRLDHVYGRIPAEISGGEQQRTALARALAPHPTILLMDEPFAALDEVLREHLRQEVLRLQREVSIPLLLVTHNLAEAYTLADRVIIFQDGQITQTGNRDDVFRRPATPRIAELMAMENVITVSATDVVKNRVRLEWWGQVVELDEQRIDPGTGTHQIGIRPEDIMIVRREGRPLEQAGDLFFEGTLIKDQARGFDHQLTFLIDDQDNPEHALIVRVPHPTFLRLELALGVRRTLVIRPSVIHLF